MDLYRQDFNFDPLRYWQAADTPDRVGMTEIKHVTGLNAFWDELRARHGGVWIDVCASGGRRIDLETISRALPLWPSDFPDIIGLPYGLGLHVGDHPAVLHWRFPPARPADGLGARLVRVAVPPRRPGGRRRHAPPPPPQPLRDRNDPAPLPAGE